MEQTKFNELTLTEVDELILKELEYFRGRIGYKFSEDDNVHYQILSGIHSNLEYINIINEALYKESESYPNKVERYIIYKDLLSKLLDLFNGSDMIPNISTELDSIEDSLSILEDIVEEDDWFEVEEL